MSNPHFEDGAFWDRFGRGLLNPDERPTPQAAADFVLSKIAQVAALKNEIEQLRHQRKCDAQQFSTFLLECQNVAEKYRPTL